ncbi:MAG: hypothetical protein AMXMBFR53_30830 [Gemmatimonadota bacterium]
MMARTTVVLPMAVAALAAWPHTVAAQHDHAASPYVDLSGRVIKALAPEEVAGLLAGDGLGFALSAELNGVPGPKHVLELADGLALSHEQREAVEAIRVRMTDEARKLGGEIVDAETRLDHMFAQGHASAEGVREATVTIGELRGRLRAAHLTAHLETARILSAEQVEAYARLRGYAGG